MKEEEKQVHTEDKNIPKTELELRKLQEEFLKDMTNSEVRDKMFMLIRIYARSLVLKNLKKTGKYLEPSRVDEISTDATCLFFREYFKNSKDGKTSSWRVSVSFAGILRLKVLEAMYSKKYAQKDDDSTLSLNSSIMKEDDSKEMIDFVSDGASLPWANNKKEFYEEGKDPLKKVIDNIDVSFQEIKNVINDAFLSLPYNLYLKFLPWLLLQFRKPKTRNIRSLFDNMFLDSRTENAFDILLLEVHNRIAQHVV